MDHGKRKYQRLIARDGDVLHPEYKWLDISESGMKFHTIKEIKKNRTLTVTLTALTEPIELKCQVMWCREAPSVYEDGYHFGVQFQDLGLMNLLELRKLIIARTA
jgi:hypothetical protein